MTDNIVRKNKNLEQKRILKHPLWLYIVFSIYAFVTFSIVQYISISRNGADALFKDKCLIIICCLLLIEVVNQVSYWLKKKKRATAILLRATMFWLIFTSGLAIYTLKLLALQKDFVFNWHEEVSLSILQIALSVILPAYSLIPEFRFLFLKGTFKR